MNTLVKNRQYYKFCLYGFLKNLRFFDAFFILFLLEKGLSYTEIGILYAIREIITNLSEIPSGILADTYGRKTALISSFLLYIISFILFYFAVGFWLFLIAFVFYGIGDAFRSGTHKGMIMYYLKLNGWQTQKINYYGHTRACSQKGSAIASLIAGSIVFYYGSYQNIFLFSIIPYLLNLLLIVSYPIELNQTAFSTSNKKSFKNTLQNLLFVIKQPQVFRLVNSSAIYSGYQKAVKDYIQPLLLQVVVLIPILENDRIDNKSGLLIGVFYFIIYLLNSRASQLSGKISKNTGRTITQYTLLIGFGLGVISGLFYIEKLWVFSLLVFVGVYLIENIRKPILTGYLADTIPNEILTSVLSAQSQWRTIITAVLALLMGAVADYFGIGIAFISISGTLLVTTMLFGNNSKYKV
jgi:MFS family permease